MQYVDNNVRSFPDTELFEVVETTEHWYWHFYECVPPIRDHRMIGGFMVGEPHSHIERNGSYVPTFLYCFRRYGKYYAALMPHDFDSAEMANVLAQVA